MEENKIITFAAPNGKTVTGNEKTAYILELFRQLTPKNQKRFLQFVIQLAEAPEPNTAKGEGAKV